MWKGALFNVTYARDKPVLIFYHGLQRQGVPVLRLQSVSGLCLLPFRANRLKDCQFLKKICGRMKREKLKRVIQRHFLNRSTGLEPKKPISHVLKSKIFAYYSEVPPTTGGPLPSVFARLSGPFLLS